MEKLIELVTSAIQRFRFKTTQAAGPLPQRLAVAIPKQEFIVTALDLARKDRIRSFELNPYSRHLDNVPFLKNEFVLTNELRERQVHFNQTAIRLFEG